MFLFVFFFAFSNYHYHRSRAWKLRRRSLKRRKRQRLKGERNFFVDAIAKNNDTKVGWLSLFQERNLTHNYLKNFYKTNKLHLKGYKKYCTWWYLIPGKAGAATSAAKAFLTEVQKMTFLLESPIFSGAIGIYWERKVMCTRSNRLPKGKCWWVATWRSKYEATKASW